MTKHRDVNKCRRKEKCKMAAQIRQANKQYEMANKPKIKKEKKKKEKKKPHVGREEETKTNHFPERRKRPELSASSRTKVAYT